MTTGTPTKIDPALIQLVYKPAGHRLFAKLTPETLPFADAPTEFLGFARLKMAGLVSQNVFSSFEIFEQRFLRIWERMKASDFKSPIVMQIAGGSTIESGVKIKLVSDPQTDAPLALLTIEAPRDIACHWHPAELELAAKRELGRTIPISINQAAIQHALTLFARFGVAAHNVPLTHPVRTATASPFFVRNHLARGFIELEIRDPTQTREALSKILQKIAESVLHAQASTNGSPFYVLNLRGILTAIAHAKNGPQRLGLEIPVTVLAASNVPELNTDGTRSLNSFATTLAWLFVRWRREQFSPKRLKDDLLFPDFAESIASACDTLATSNLIRKDRDQYRPAMDAAISTHRECSPTSSQYFKQTIDLAEETIHAIDVSDRDIQALTLSLTRTSVESVLATLKQLPHEISKILANDKGADRISHIGWQFFPLTKPPGMEGVLLSEDIAAHLMTKGKRCLNFLIREMVALSSFHPDADWIAKKLYPIFTPAEIRTSIATLEKQGLITFAKARNRYMQVDRDIKTSEVVEGLAVADYHREMLDFARAAMHYAKVEHRSICALTVNVSKESAPKIRELLLATLGKIFSLAGSDNDPDTLFQMNLQFFPITKMLTLST